LACSDGPTEALLTDTTTFSDQRVIAAVTCAADVSGGSLDCKSSRPAVTLLGPRFLIVGGQGTLVQLTSTGVEYVANMELFKADVTVTNLIGQPLGTLDGITTTGVRVFFHLPAYVTDGTGTITLTNASGTGDFTGTGQEYFEYNDILDYEVVSDEKKWEWSVPATVNTFAFQVYVDADVQYPDGWVDVTPAAASVTVGNTVGLNAVVRTVLGWDTGGGVTWTSGDEAIATVDASGTVTGVAAGTVTITASSGGLEADGTAEITVTADGA
jgi:hypothetical protein